MNPRTNRVLQGSGRGERRQTSTTDLVVPVRLPLEIALTGVERWIGGAIV
jgi:hypothetical protein